MSILADKAMLVSLSIRQWTARRLDRKITDEVNREHNASADAGRYNKLLISKDALAEINKIAGKARTRHYELTLPWSDNGTRLLSSLGYTNYCNEMRELMAEFNAAADRLEPVYPDLVAQRRIELNGLFDPDDYPPASEIRRRFRFTYDISPVPSAGDFRVEVSDAVAAEIKADIEDRANAALAEAQKHVWQRIAECAKRMSEKLRSYEIEETGDGKSKVKGIFRDSLVENIRELVNLLPTLNVAGDKTLAEMGSRLVADLCQFDANDLRESESIRIKTAEKAEAILDECAGFLA